MYGNYFAMREPMDEKGLCNTLPLFYRGFHGFLHINVRLAYSLEGTRGKKHIPRGRVIHDKISERKLTRGGIIEYDYECHEKHFSMVSLAGPVSAERIRPEHVCNAGACREPTWKAHASANRLCGSICSHDVMIQ